MFELIIGIVIGAFIGWNVPQPEYAKKIQNKISELFKK